MTPARGRFVTFEGGEGCGKSTQIALLAKTLRGRGVGVTQTREPGGSTGAEEIRSLLVRGETDRWDPVSETLLLYAARRDHICKTIVPALERGDWVLCDRFNDSSVAYQGAGEGVDVTFLSHLYKVVAGSLIPDVTFILDLPVSEGISRTRIRGNDEDRYERMDLTFHERLRQGFLAIARENPSRCVVIDACGTPDEVHTRITAELSRRLDLPVLA